MREYCVAFLKMVFVAALKITFDFFIIVICKAVITRKTPSNLRIFSTVGEVVGDVVGEVVASIPYTTLHYERRRVFNIDKYYYVCIILIPVFFFLLCVRETWGAECVFGVCPSRLWCGEGCGIVHVEEVVA